MTLKFREPHPSRKLSGILRHSLVAVRRWVASEWLHRIESPNLVVVFGTLPNDGQQVMNESQTPMGAAGPSPSCSLYLTQMQERPAPYNPWASHFVGFPVGYTPGHREQIIEKVKPVELGIGVRFRTHSADEALAFSALWVENQPNVAIEIISSAGAPVVINLDLGTTVTLPTGEGPSQEELTVETSIICRTFSGYVELRRTVKTIEIGEIDDLADNQVTLSRIRVDRHGNRTKVPL